MNSLKKHLNFETELDWYRLRRDDVIAFGGSSLLRYHDDSVYTLLKTIYPEYKWLPWYFSS